jgi:hypothetical protein
MPAPSRATLRGFAHGLDAASKYSRRAFRVKRKAIYAEKHIPRNFIQC